MIFQNRNFIYFVAGFSLDQLGSPYATPNASTNHKIVTPEESRAYIDKIMGRTPKSSTSVPTPQPTSSINQPQSNGDGNSWMNKLFGDPILNSAQKAANKHLKPEQQPLSVSNPVSEGIETGQNVLSAGLDIGGEVLKNSGAFGKVTGLESSLNQAGNALDQASQAVGGTGGRKVVSDVKEGVSGLGQDARDIYNASTAPVKSPKDITNNRRKRDIALNNAVQHGMQTVFAPANVLPSTIKQGVAAPFEELNRETTNAVKMAGIDPNSDRGKDIIMTINNLAQIGTLKQGKDVAPEVIDSAKNITRDAATKGGELIKLGTDSISNIGEKMGEARKNRIINSRVKELTKLQENNATVRKVIGSAEKNGIDLKKEIAQTDLLKDTVDSDGTIRTESAIDKINEFIRPQEDVIGSNLRKEGKMISLTDVESKLKADIKKSGVKGGALVRALKNVESDIEGYKLEANPKGEIPLATLHDAKVDKYANIDYLNPESSRVDKVIAKSLKKLVEDNAKTIDVKQLNSELSKYYSMQNFLEKLNGKKVAGGRLGKYFAQGVGGMVGSAFGPLGTIVGAEVGNLVKGRKMMSTFKGKTNFELKPSEIMQKAMGGTP